MTPTEFKVLQDGFKAQSAQIVQDFGVPDRLVLDSDVKLWRIGGIVVEDVRRDESFAWGDLTPVYSESGKVLGVARLYPFGNSIHASATLDAACPERLDYELGGTLYLGLRELDMENPVYAIGALTLANSHGMDVGGRYIDVLDDEVPVFDPQ